MRLYDYLKTLRYPGRFIAVGRCNNGVLAVYGATGRSAASLARKYVIDEHKDVWAQHTDEVAAKEGNLELLEYRALRWQESGFVMANGRHIEGGWESCDPEPDAYLTPRITCVVEGGSATLYISRATTGGVERTHWPLTLEEGKGYFISTYTGVDVRPTPSFAGDPVLVDFQFSSAETAAEEVFNALLPEYRIGVVGASMNGSTREVAIYNKL